LATFLYRLGHLAVRHRRSVLAAWVALLLLAAGASGIAGGTTTDDISLPGTESQQAFDLLEERFPEEGGSFTQVVFAAGEGGSLADPAAADAIDATMAAMGEVEGVSAALTPSATGALSSDATVALGVVRYPASAYEVEDETIEAVAEAAGQATEAGVTVEFGGQVVPGVELEPPSSELLGLGVAVLVLLLSFGSVLAMGLPIATALLGLGIGMSGIGLASAFVDLSSTAPTLAVMIGLAVGIDYALFVVTRHRQNLAVGLDVEESAARANATAGGAVVFAGVTVVIAIAGLAVIGIPFVTVMGLAAAATVAIAVLVAITLLPALLGFAGHNIDRLRVPGLQNRTGGLHEGETLGTRWARAVTRRPVVALIGGLAVMGVLAIPVASMRLGLPDAGSEPADTTQRRAYDLVTESFGPGFNGQLTVIVDLTGVEDRDAALADVATAVGAHDGVAVVAPAKLNDTGDTAVLQVIPTTGPAAAETESLVHDLRGETRAEVEQGTGARYHIAGSTAANIDISDKLADALVPFMVLVIGLTVVLLTAVFRSILVPVKAALAILVSIGSSFGVIVAVFNWGWLAELIGVEQTIPIVSFLPVMMFAILFGLSMDYEVFILSRIHEEYHRTGDARGSVLTGISSSARVITAAALIMISVFAAFALGDSPIIKMFGLGLATAVLLDATVVRMVIVPAVMTLFGDHAWRLPRWLDRVLPNLDVEGEKLVDRLEAHDAEVAARRAAARGEDRRDAADRDASPIAVR
jgi:RND superfamily putative drug exporter